MTIDVQWYKRNDEEDIYGSNLLVRHAIFSSSTADCLFLC